MKNKKIPHCHSSSKAEAEITLIPLTQIQDRALCRFDTDTSMKSWWAKLVLRSQTSSVNEMTYSCKDFTHISKI